MGTNFTLFQNSGGGGSGSSDYVKDAFSDISLPADSNAGFTSTISTNPLNYSLLNDDAPRYQTKTLFIQDLVLLNDRSKWINNKPTYEVVWNENFIEAKGYVYGNIRLLTTTNGKCVEIYNIDDAFGVTGVIRKIAWIVNPGSEASASADLITDGVDTGNDITFSALATDSEARGINHFSAFLHDASNATKNIHDYRVQANQYTTLSVVGVIVYYENATANIDLFPGSTYVDKEKQTTSGITAMVLPTIVGRNGAKTLISKTAQDSYLSTTIETAYVPTVGVGSSGTNLIDVTTGQGASFPIGVGVIAALGTSFYVGSVSNQSTDTLTVSPTLPIGVSGLLYKAWHGGPTLPISATLYALTTSFDPFLGNTYIDPNGFGKQAVGDFYYSDPNFKYRIWGDQLALATIEGYRGVAFNGNTAGFLQVDGQFCAAELEISGAGIIHGTFSINGIPSWGINEGISGIIKKTVFADAGPGWNSFVFSPGQSFINVTFTKINMYNRATPASITFGQLADFDTNANTALRFSNTTNASLMPIGGWQRIYADQLYTQGGWIRGTTHSQAGGVFYIGASTNSVFKFQYYGTHFGIAGVAGTSGVLLLDGVSTAVNFNAVTSVPTLGFHSIQYTNAAGTAIIAAIDFLKPSQSEFRPLQNFLSSPQLDDAPVTFVQEDTPRNPKNGDIWAQDKANNVIWIRLFGVWNRLTIAEFSDDPNVLMFVRSHGSSTGAEGGNGQDAELFNNVSWSVAVSSTGGARGRLSKSDNRFNLLHNAIDGENTANANAALFQQFNKYSWSGATVRASPKVDGASGQFNGVLYSNRGTTTVSSAQGTNAADKWSGTAWGSGTAWANSNINSGCFVVGVLMSVVGGQNTSDASVDIHETRTFSDTIALATVIPVVGQCQASTANNVGLITAITSSAATTAAYSWNGASWSAALTATYSQYSSFPGAQAHNRSRLKMFGNGGQTTSTSGVVSSAQSFNGVAFSVETASITARGRGPVGSWI